MKTFFQLFESYLTDKNGLENYFELPVRSCKINRKAKLMIISMISQKFVPFDEIEMIEKEISREFGLNCTRVEFIYENLPFSAEYAADIFKLLRRDHAKLNGFLTGATVQFENNNLNINLKNGGLPVMKEVGVDKLIRDYINGHFQMLISISFDGATITTDEMFAESVANIETYVPTPTTPPPARGSASYSPAPPQQKPKPTRSYSSSSSVKVNGESVAGKSAEQLGYYPDSAQIVFGSAIHTVPTPIGEVSPEDGAAVIFGKIFKTDFVKTRSGNRYIITMYITDYTGSYILKMFTTEREFESLDKEVLSVKGGVHAVIKGKITLDTYENDYVMKPVALMTVKPYEVTDMSEDKRVELHMHTIMSSKDGIATAEDLINTAFKWGHKAIAVTDHGVVQAFPNAMNAVEAIRRGGGEFKVIYGTEAYFVNDYVDAVTGESDLPLNAEMIVFDVETTGLNPNAERLTEIGAVRIKDGEIIEEFDTFVNPERHIPEKITELTGITDDMVKDAPDEATALKMLMDFAGDKPLIAHNATFDMSFIKATAKRNNIDYDPVYIDTLPMAKSLLTNLKKHKLDIVAKELGLDDFNHHRACDDARVLGQIFNRFIEMFKKVTKNKYK